MKKINKLVLLLITVLLVACTHKELYQFGESIEKNECLENAGSEQELDDCQKEKRPSFEEYEQQKKAIHEQKIS